MDTPRRKEKANFIKKAKAALISRPSARKLKPLNIETSHRTLKEVKVYGDGQRDVDNISNFDLSNEKRNCSSRALSADRLFSLRRNENQDCIHFHSNQCDQSSSPTLRTSFRSPCQITDLKANKQRSNSVTLARSFNLSSASNSAAQLSSLNHHSHVEKISLSGSERGVEVPTDLEGSSPPDYNTGSHNRCNLLPPAYMPTKPMSTRMSVTNVPRLPRTVPPRAHRQPSLERDASVVTHSTNDQLTLVERSYPTPLLKRHSSMRQPRPPPPPYYSNKSRQSTNSSPTEHKSAGVNSLRCTPVDGSGISTFQPKTSTPNANVIGNARQLEVAVSRLNENTFNDLSLSCNVPVEETYTDNKRLNADNSIRREVWSFYDNITDYTTGAMSDRTLDSQASDSTLTSDVIPEMGKSNDCSMVWYEYGCV